MIAIGLLLVRMLCDWFKSRRRLEAEILVLRHQLKDFGPLADCSMAPGRCLEQLFAQHVLRRGDQLDRPADHHRLADEIASDACTRTSRRPLVSGRRFDFRQDISMRKQEYRQDSNARTNARLGIVGGGRRRDAASAADSWAIFAAVRQKFHLSPVQIPQATS
jgi:hypothetical protein